MRVFIGIQFDEETRRDIETFLSPFKRISSPIKWIKPENIHLTLKFIGEVSSAQYKEIKTALINRQYTTGPLDIDFSGCGTFSRGYLINIFWLGIRQNPKLEALYRDVEEALQKKGIPPEKRPFKPHITLGRNKREFNAGQLMSLIEKRASEPVSRFRARSFQLFKSELFKTGPVYTIQEEISLDTA